MRVEKNQEIKEELQQTKKELSAQISKDTRKSHPYLACLLVVIIGIIIFAAWAASFVAKTGFVEIPVFTSVFYEKPEPTRYVVATTPVEETAADQLTALVNQKLLGGQGLGIDRDITIDLTEGSFTASSRMLLATVDKVIDPTKAQVAVVHPDRLEIFVPMKNNKLESAFTVSFLPSITVDGLLGVEIGDVYVGSAKIPNWLVGFFANRVLHMVVNDLNQGLGKYVSLQSLSVEDGFVNLHGILTVEIIEL
jgi:hypothetical protein